MECVNIGLSMSSSLLPEWQNLWESSHNLGIGTQTKPSKGVIQQHIECVATHGIRE